MAILSEIHKIINSLWKKEELPDEWKVLIIIPIYKVGDKTECSNYRHMSIFLTSYTILSSILLSNLTPYEEELLRNIRLDFGATNQLLVIYSGFVKCLKKKGRKRRSTSDIYTPQERLCFTEEGILYNTLVLFGIPMKLVRLIITCLNETCSRV
jgi:hypothetical protein